MATEAQFNANRTNAALSTGPVTPEGKARTASNALKLGLFSLRNIIQPDEEAFYNDYSTALWRELHPRGPSQETQAAEILRASWRLHRIANAEAALGDLSATITGETTEPVLLYQTAPTQAAIDRARQQTLRNLRQATAELTRLKELAKDQSNTRHQRTVATIPASIRTNTPENAGAKQTQSEPASAPQFGRNSPCPCGSNQKYKRCCGHGASAVMNAAPAVLNQAA
jgi:SEC-C motif